MTKPKPTPAEVLSQWLELDLAQSAAADELPRAFEVDDTVDQVSELLTAGRIPILCGDEGVGKTAIVYELARRTRDGRGPGVLRGRRLVQVSLARRASELNKPGEQMRPHSQRLIDALLKHEGDVAPFFRDLHLAMQFDLESQFELLALRFPGPILAEGHRESIERMLEWYPGLQRRYVLLHLAEPTPARAARILSAWAADRAARGVASFEPTAVDAAINLTHRFLARSRMPRKAIELLSQVGAFVGAARPAQASDVIERFCRSHHVPRVLVDPTMTLDLREVEDRFKSELLGQPDAVSSLVNMIGLVKAGLADFRRPFGVFLFVGPTGVGKTHAAQLLAEFLFGSPDRVIRINLADFPGEEDAAVLFGNPQEQGVLRQGTLTTRVAGQPFAVLLLDELEKAHAKLHDRFLQLFDEGCFINGAGETISCRSMIIIATSNAGAEVYRGQTFGFSGRPDRPDRDAEVDRRLETHFRFEFLNRFDRIVHFRPLSREDIRTIALRELQRLQDRTGLRQRSLTLEVDESVLDWLAVHGYDPDHGARFLRRTIERHVTTALADTIVRDAVPAGATIRLAVRHNAIAARAAVPAAPAEPKLAVALPRGVTVETALRDRAGLEAEAARIAAAAAPLLNGLEDRREQRSRLLAAMNEPGFWENTPQRHAALDRFRALDVAVRVEDRFARPIQQLRAMTPVAPGEDAPARFSQAVERAAAALSEWQLRLDEEGAGPVWLMVSAADPLRAGGEWVATLTKMELEWTRRLHLAASVIAYGEEDGELRRTVLEVEGPGASAFLEMEQGIHRLRRPKGADARARIDVVPKGPTPDADWPSLRAVARKPGRYGLQLDRRARIEFAAHGLAMTFVAADARSLAHFLHDLRASLPAALGREAQTARLYADSNEWVRDPRIDSPPVRLKDALEGRLDPLLDAWRQRSRASV